MKLLPYEIWRDIPGYEGMYQASSMGNIRSVDRVILVGTRKHKRHGKVLVPRMAGKYLQVNLSCNGKRKMLLVHRLVALTFIPNPHGLPEVNHKDENPLNNSVFNIEWCDKRYNLNYGNRIGKIKRCLYKPIVQLTQTNDVVKVWQSAIEVNEKNNWSRASISMCCRGKRKTAYGYKWEYYD